ncbi:MAG: TIGR02996 domain-containing protein [Gemmataceae bacterium]
MSEVEQSLLDAVLENPDDDLQRLVYADYLDEQGDPKRAEFIRMQISIASSIENDQLDSPEYVQAVKYSVSLRPEDYIPWIEANLFSMTDTSKPYVNFDRDHFQFRTSDSHVNFEYHRGFLTAVIAPANWVIVNFPRLLETPVELIQFRHDPFFQHGVLSLLRRDGEWYSILKFDEANRIEQNWGETREALKLVPGWLSQCWINHPFYRDHPRLTRIIRSRS